MKIATELFKKAKAIALILKKEDPSKDDETVFYETMADIVDFVSREIDRVETSLRKYLKNDIINDLKTSEDESE